MTVGLFIPCYIDQFYPHVGVATLRLLEKLDVSVEYPLDQTCCGQPMANAGCEQDAAGTAELFFHNFETFDYVVAPSGSCVHHVRYHYSRIEGTVSGGVSPEDMKDVQHKTYELCEFITDILGIEHVEATFPHRVGLHQSCHGLRGLELGTPSELRRPRKNKVRSLLEGVGGLELVELERGDECCGFGGTFAVQEEAVSVKMGLDRIADHTRHAAEVITGTDVSCLMHLEGLIRRRRIPVRVMHVAEILANSRL